MSDTTDLKFQIKEVFYQIVKTYNHKEDRCYFHSEEKLAKKMKVARKTVSRSILKLEKEYWLLVKRRGIKNRNEYRINWDHKADHDIDDDGVVARLRQLAEKDDERVGTSVRQLNERVGTVQSKSWDSGGASVWTNMSKSWDSRGTSVWTPESHRHSDYDSVNKDNDYKHNECNSLFEDQDNHIATCHQPSAVIQQGYIYSSSTGAKSRQSVTERLFVLNKLSEQVRQCHLHAEHCAQQATVQTDPKPKN
jgi:hypothetical protein